jgi:hypothetical protein
MLLFKVVSGNCVRYDEKIIWWGANGMPGSGHSVRSYPRCNLSAYSPTDWGQ